MTDRDELLAQGFADCEVRAVAMLSAMTPAKYLPAMPVVHPQRPLDDNEPNGYLESTKDWVANNLDAVEWFLMNHETIGGYLLYPRVAVMAVQTGQHRTDAYDTDQLLGAHRRFVNRSQASKAGKAAAGKLTSKERQQRGKDAIERRWAKKRSQDNKTTDKYLDVWKPSCGHTEGLAVFDDGKVYCDLCKLPYALRNRGDK